MTMHTPEQIEEWARDADLTTTTGWRDDGSTCEYWEAWPEQLTRFAALVAQHEMERCAHIAARYVTGPSASLAEQRQLIAAAIRNTGG